MVKQTTLGDLNLRSHNNDSKTLQIIAWISTFLACLFLMGLYFLASFVIEKFANMFAGMGVELPLPTRLVISTRWLLHVPFVVAGILVLGKELVIRDKKRSLVTTLIVAAGMLLTVGFMCLALYLPLFRIQQH